MCGGVGGGGYVAGKPKRSGDWDKEGHIRAQLNIEQQQFSQPPKYMTNTRPRGLRIWYRKKGLIIFQFLVPRPAVASVPATSTATAASGTPTSAGALPAVSHKQGANSSPAGGTRTRGDELLANGVRTAGVLLAQANEMLTPVALVANMAMGSLGDVLIDIDEKRAQLPATLAKWNHTQFLPL